eukprot:COSAG02_NODE_4242_length_5594_cov_2.769063_5_plen_144_part_00
MNFWPSPVDEKWTAGQAGNCESQPEDGDFDWDKYDKQCATHGVAAELLGKMVDVDMIGAERFPFCRLATSCAYNCIVGQTHAMNRLLMGRDPNWNHEEPRAPFESLVPLVFGGVRAGIAGHTLCAGGASTRPSRRALCQNRLV